MDKRYYFIAEEARRILIEYIERVHGKESFMLEHWKTKSLEQMLDTATADRLAREAGMPYFQSYMLNEGK